MRRRPVSIDSLRGLLRANLHPCFIEPVRTEDAEGGSELERFSEAMLPDRGRSPTKDLEVAARDDSDSGGELYDSFIPTSTAERTIPSVSGWCWSG